MSLLSIRLCVYKVKLHKTRQKKCPESSKLNNPELSEGEKMVVHQPTKVETHGDPLGCSRKSQSYT